MIRGSYTLSCQLAVGADCVRNDAWARLWSLHPLRMMLGTGGRHIVKVVRRRPGRFETGLGPF